MSLRPRKEVEKLEICPHGGLNRAELRQAGLTAEAVLDFSVCCHPFPPAPDFRQLLDSIVLNRYPDPEATEFRQCLSRKLGVAAPNILAGNGAVELIRLIALAYFGPGDAVLILEPTFGEYKTACQIMGAEVLTQRGRETDNFVPDLPETARLIRRHHPKGIFICNPGNPAGYYLTRQELEPVWHACQDGLLILDEAYVNFVAASWSALDLIQRGNVIILRSMTKDYALAGLRLGYAVAAEEIISALRRVCPPWNVNAVAQQAGVIALNDAGSLERWQREIRRTKNFLVDELGRIGFTIVPSKTNFFLVRVKNGHDFRAALLKQGILVRDCASFGLPQYVRIAARTLPECQRLITAIRQVVGGGRQDII